MLVSLSIGLSICLCVCVCCVWASWLSYVSDQTILWLQPATITKSDTTQLKGKQLNATSME